MFILILWQITILIQVIFSYGTAYRLAKTGGDNGVSLFGWLWLMQLASLIPGLGIYLWFKYRDADYGYNDYEQQQTHQLSTRRECLNCGTDYDSSIFPCPNCKSRKFKPGKT